jgi:hypothetical protein
MEISEIVGSKEECEIAFSENPTPPIAFELLIISRNVKTIKKKDH